MASLFAQNDYLARVWPILPARKGSENMRGINHRVVELHPENSEWIETVWVVLRPGAGEVHLAESRQEAERFANGLICWKRRAFAAGWKTAALAGLAAVGLAVLLWVL